MTFGIAVDVPALRLIRSNRLFCRSFRAQKKDAKPVDNTQLLGIVKP